MNKTIGILAHVDAGKTTFPEQVLYHTKSIRKRRRVDHKDSFLDNHEIEKQRGITVFSQQGIFNYKDCT
ncbi:GTP-binding protein [Clostridium sp. Marseille-Q2269]|uniref:GTP-binding protein n=1 Tax=Clostridium sp. Marseille-Q2269 TaxID=2942205 RepID=UPI0033656373